MPETVLVGSVYHESNTFASSPDGRPAFEGRRELFGDEMPAELRGTDSEVGGLIDVAEAEGAELAFTVLADGGAGGVVARAAYEHYASVILDGVRRAGDDIDGILLPLHGAMVAEHVDDGEGELLERVRDEVGPELPVVVTLDPHANVTERMVDLADALIAYETIPHVDMAATGRTGMTLLLDMIREGYEPSVAVERPPVLAFGPTHNTNRPPMSDVMARARELEAADGVEKLSVCPGFWQADFPEMGFSVVAVGAEAAAREAARELAALVWDRHSEFTTEFTGPEEGVARAAELAEDADGPVVVAEMNDNPGGGAPGDGTPVLRAMLDRGVAGGFAVLRDPKAVAACVEAGVGSEVTLTLGGKTESPELHGEPIEGVEGYVKAITDGRYRNRGPMMTGVEVNFGRAALLQCGELNVILTAGLAQPWDAEVWRHVGVPPERLDVIAVKSAGHFRADYERFASHVVETNGPGLATHDPGMLPLSRVTRPKYPIDPMAEDDYPDWEE